MRKTHLFKKGLAALAALLLPLATVAGTPAALADAGGGIAIKPVYRLYNNASQEHLYTTSLEEKANLESLLHTDWTYEGIAWYAPEGSSQAVHRVYNPNSGEHHYTTDANEVSVLASLGWNDEGIAWYSADPADYGSAQTNPIYRLYNPAAGVGAHHFTGDANEYQVLQTPGYNWSAEGIAWYGMSADYAGSYVNASLVAANDYYAGVKATVNLNGSGSGYHIKLVMAGPNSNGEVTTVSWGIQYDTAQPSAGSDHVAFLMENIMSNGQEAGLRGKEYLFYNDGAATVTDTDLELRFYPSNSTLHGYVNGRDVMSTTTNLVSDVYYTVAIEGSARQNGDTIDASARNVVVSLGANGRYGTAGDGWHFGNDYFGLHATQTQGGSVNDGSADPRTSTNGAASYGIGVRFTGTVSIGAQYDWDTCFQTVEPSTGQTGKPLSSVISIGQA